MGVTPFVNLRICTHLAQVKFSSFTTDATVKLTLFAQCNEIGLVQIYVGAKKKIQIEKLNFFFQIGSLNLEHINIQCASVCGQQQAGGLKCACISPKPNEHWAGNILKCAQCAYFYLLLFNIYIFMSNRSKTYLCPIVCFIFGRKGMANATKIN